MQGWRRLGAWSTVAAVLAALVAGCGNSSNTAEAQQQAAAAVGAAFKDEVGRAQRAAASSSTVTTTVPVTVPPTTPTTAPPPTMPPVTIRPVAAADPASLAAQIVEAETGIRDAATPPDRLVALAHVQQVAYRALGNHPEWDADVLARVPAELQQAVQLNVDARRQFRSMHTKLSDTLPAWRIIEPAAPAELLGYYQKAQDTFGVSWQYLAAINLVETAMGRIQGLSVAGAQGPMQFMPSTWEAFGTGDINSPHDSIMAAANYLRHNGFVEGNIRGALFNYNRSDKYVQGVVDYATLMQADPRAYYGFWGWQVYYLSSAGDVLLPVGYEQPQPVPAADWLTAHPQ